ncbi:MAG: thiolase family protein [Gammaproteobacteria bacterium]|nr:thiolase family protein [Gammaproteobacteria bacterium]
MSKVYIIGSYSTAFGRRPQDSVKDLTREAYEQVLSDAGFDDGGPIETIWFGNCGMWTENQGGIRGQVCLTPMVREGRLPERIPLMNVEGGCATASLALNGAWKDILSGQAEMSLAMGVEKTFYPDDPEQVSKLYYGGIDQYDPHEWETYYRDAGETAGKAFEPGPDRTIFMDTYAMQACYHMKRYGTTQRQIAAGAAKNHNQGALNPKAQYRFQMTTDEVLADRPITYPLTRSMCAPIGDGAAAAIVCSERVLKTLPSEVRERAVCIAAQGLSGGKYRSLDEDGLSRFAAERAYRMADITPDQIDVAEVHDATSFCEIYQVEMMDFCARGDGGAFVESGATALGGQVPVNTSGGLVSKGHPVGATGLSMTAELVQQLRGEAGERQVEGAHWALAENGGGVIGFDEAACSVLILHR